MLDPCLDVRCPTCEDYINIDIDHLINLGQETAEGQCDYCGCEISVGFHLEIHQDGVDIINPGKIPEEEED